MLPILYWTNMSGIYDYARIQDRYYFATIGGVQVTDRNLFPLLSLTFSDGLPSNVILSVDTLLDAIWFASKGGIGYVDGEDVVVYPSSSLPISNFRGTRGAFSYGEHYIVYSDEWVLDINTRGTLNFSDDRIRVVEINRIEPIARRPINYVAVHRDSIYIGDSLGVIATRMDFLDIPASYRRVLSLNSANIIRFINDTLYIGTGDGLYTGDSAIYSGYSVIYFDRWRDTLFLSLRTSGNHVYSPGFLGKLYDGNFSTELIPSPYMIIPAGDGLLISSFYIYGDMINENSKAIGLISYPDFIPHFFGMAPFNYITNIYADDDWLYVFSGRNFNRPHDTLSFMGFDYTNFTFFNPDDPEDYSVRGVSRVDDTTFVVATFFSIFKVFQNGSYRKCYDGIPDDGDAFTSILAIGDTIYATAHSGQVFMFLNDCSTRLTTPYSVVGIPRAIAYNESSHLIAVGGDGGFAVFDGNAQVFTDNNLQVKTIEPFGQGFLVGTGQGLYRFNGTSIRSIPSVQSGITDITTDPTGYVWVLASDGLYQLDRFNLNVFEKYRLSGISAEFTSNWPLKNNLAIYSDTLLLAGTSEGIAVIDLRRTHTVLDSIILYPNPAYDEFNIRGVACGDLNNVRVMTMTGIPVRTEYTCNNGKIHVDVRNLRKGLYIVDIILKSGRKVLKLIKE